jgi:3-isopropylmalate/(R)-2-methylmalate dehydratase small subunit
MNPLGTHTGRVAWVFDHNFDVDQVVGVANIKVQDVTLQAPNAMAHFEPGFHTRVRPGDLLVAGRNFGYGHPHAIAMRTMRHLGIAGVVAESFFSSFWLGEVGYGFRLLVCPGIHTVARRGDELHVDWDQYTVTNRTTGAQLAAIPHTQRERQILAHGGLKPMLAAQRAARAD